MYTLRGDWALEARQQWPSLTDEDLHSVERWDQLVDAVKGRYALSREEAEEQVDLFCDAIGLGEDIPGQFSAGHTTGD